MTSKGEFTAYLWEQITPIFNKIVGHPFTRGLSDGTLPQKCFDHYLAQDILYIHDDSLALARLAKKATIEEDQLFFRSLASDGIAIEQSLHNEFVKHFNLVTTDEKSELIDAYTRFILDTVNSRPYAVAASALLPCFWVYNKVGECISERKQPGNPFQIWIETYEGDEYKNYTHRFIQIVEDLSIEASKELRSEMTAAFVKSSQFELQFFEEAWSKCC